ncbi:MAG: cysteine metabolism transcriptional regulator CymR [Bacilli bacterium]
MKISTKGRYGLTIMMELARHYGTGPLSLKAIAQSQNLSEHYLEQLITPLRNAQLVKSIRGAYGGYVLTKSPAEMSVYDIIRTLEGPIRIVDEEEGDSAKDLLWSRVTVAVRQVFQTTMLNDLISQNEHNDHMFYI